MAIRIAEVTDDPQVLCFRKNGSRIDLLSSRYHDNFRALDELLAEQFGIIATAGSCCKCQLGKLVGILQLVQTNYHRERLARNVPVDDWVTRGLDIKTGGAGGAAAGKQGGNNAGCKKNP